MGTWKFGREKSVEPEWFEGVEDDRTGELEWIYALKDELIPIAKILTPRQRQVLVLLVALELTQAEASRELGVSKQAVLQGLRAIRRRAASPSRPRRRRRS